MAKVMSIHLPPGVGTCFVPRMHHSMLLKAEGTALLVVDIQERLAAAMPADTASQCVRNAEILFKGMGALGLPSIVTEQYPTGLGATVPTLRELLAVSPIEKICFDAHASEGVREALRAQDIRNVIMAGMEAHVCVLQTALSLKHHGYETFVADDAVCSRQDAHRKSALKTMRQAGVTCLPTESLLFSMLEEAGTPQFKAISQLVK